MKKITVRIYVCLVMVLCVQSLASAQTIEIDVFDGSGIGTAYNNFSSLAVAHADFMGVVQDSITFSEYDAGTVINNQYSTSKGVTFSNLGQQLACVMYEGYNSVSGYILEPLDGYDGSYKPDMDKALAEYPNNSSPFTIAFANPVSAVGSFVGMGKEDSIDTLTITAFDTLNNALTVFTVKTAPWADDRNREGLWGIRSSSANIAKITISNDSSVSYANALIFDSLQWSSQPVVVPEPSTIGILSLGILSLIRKKKNKD